MQKIISFLSIFKDSAKDVLPIILVIAFFQTFVFQEVPENLFGLITGMLIVIFGLAIFIKGLEIGIFPIGESLANKFALKGSLFWLLCFAFLIGFATTVAEPALIAIAQKASVISAGKIDASYLRFTVALSVGSAIALGAFRIITGHPIHFYIIFGYVLVVVLTFFTPKEIIGLAYDSGGVTTSTVTVPLVAALGIGLASSIRGRNPIIDGFGLIAFASLTPMIFVQAYGIIAMSDSSVSLSVAKAIEVVTHEEISIFFKIIFELFSVIKDLIPIIAILLFFQYVIIKKPIPNLKTISLGFLFVIIGLYAFIVGLDMGLFPLGDYMANQLTSVYESGHSKYSVWITYIFAYAIGFSTTMAEPSLLAIAIKVESISSGQIRSFALRFVVAIGVAIGIALGAYRIVVGHELHYYIMVGYVVVIIQTYFAPRWIIPIAYDSGGVTTSTVTVPLVTALGLGLAQNIPGRSVLIDGFGLIAFASLFPIITVLGYGIYVKSQLKEGSSKI